MVGVAVAVAVGVVGGVGVGVAVGVVVTVGVGVTVAVAVGVMVGVAVVGGVGVTVAGIIMRYTVHDAPQGSDEWLLARLGRVTSSGANAMISLDDLAPLDATKKKRGNDESRLKYALKLAIERITGCAADDSFSTGPIERGKELEPLARNDYLARHPEYDVREVGLLVREDGRVATSPDGLCYEGGALVGGVEFKCPSPHTHWAWREVGGVPREHLRQMVHHLYMVPDARWWDFVSYHPGFPGALARHDARLTRTEVQPLLDRYGAAVVALLADVDDIEARMRQGA